MRLKKDGTPDKRFLSKEERELLAHQEAEEEHARELAEHQEGNDGYIKEEGEIKALHYPAEHGTSILGEGSFPPAKENYEQKHDPDTGKVIQRRPGESAESDTALPEETIEQTSS